MELGRQEDTNSRTLRARDRMDRCFAEPLDVATLASTAHVSLSHLGRLFKRHRLLIAALAWVLGPLTVGVRRRPPPRTTARHPRHT